MGAGLLFFCFSNVTCYQSVGDGGTYPDFCEQVVRAFGNRLKDRDFVLIDGGNEDVDYKDCP